MKNCDTDGGFTAPQPHWTRRTLSGRWTCSVETLKRMEKAGKLPFLKIGRAVRYRREAIEQIEKEAEVIR